MVVGHKSIPTVTRFNNPITMRSRKNGLSMSDLGFGQMRGVVLVAILFLNINIPVQGSGQWDGFVPQDPPVSVVLGLTLYQDAAYPLIS